MLVYNQSWVEEPSRKVMKQAGPLWNMWKTRKSPFSELEDGQSVLMTATKGPGQGMIMYESQTRFLVKDWYTSKNDAWKKIEAAIPQEFRLDEDGNALDREYFLTRDYTMAAPKSGWLIGWLDKPIRWIGEPRPSALVLQRNGWGNIPDTYVPNSSKSSKSSKASVSTVSEDDKHEKAILERTDIGPREKQTLVNSRRGQGKFRSRIGEHEDRCRVTGTTAKKHLVASHIQPWVLSDDEQKLDGFNGLLLAPHIDHLFDGGFISFKDNGDLLISSKLNKAILSEWGIPVSMNVGKFKPKQREYLKHHRKVTFKK